MKKENFVKEIAQRTKISPDVVVRVLDSFTEALADAVSNDHTVSLRGFGKFKSSIRKARSMQNFQTGERFIAPEKKVPKFTFSKDFIRNISEK